MTPIQSPPYRKRKFGIIPNDYIELGARRTDVEDCGDEEEDAAAHDDEVQSSPPLPSSEDEALSSFITVIPDALLDFLTVNEVHENTTQEPLPKRLKSKIGPELEQSNDHRSDDYIVVKQSSLEIRCAESKLFSNGTILSKQKARFNCHWSLQSEKPEPSHITIQDDNGNPLLTVPLSLEYALMSILNPFDDVLICLLVDRDSKKYARQSSKLWTEVGISLQRRDDSDYIQIIFTIKWDVTVHPESIQPKKTDALLKVLSAYFPDPNGTNLDSLSAQDFYQSAYSPDPNDELAASIETPELQATLYPFQKRAVQWLLRREGYEWSRETRSVQGSQFKATCQLPLSFIAATDAQGRSCYVSHLFGIVTFDLAPFLAIEREIKGGILAEEMGLGKTIETIALLTLHTRPNQGPSIFDPFTGENLQTTNATLIISPPSISRQWIGEIKTHAPHLKVTYYEGIKSRNVHYATIMEEFATSNVVVTTYAVLSSEINFTSLNPGRTLRRESKYQRTKSPLMQFSWWRVCLDEAQMVESGVGKAATVARMIPRINAWAITGTPVTKNIDDLLGLLIFLRYEPLITVWRSLLSSPYFRGLFNSISLSNRKKDVRGELDLPQQHRFVITLPFTPIEEQYYQELFGQMCEESGLSTEGAPLTDDWDPEGYTEVMRRWLVRLRQIALHPEVGGRNKLTFRRNKEGDEPVTQTAIKVLEHMFSQTDVAIRTNHRLLLMSQLKRGQLYEDSPRVQEALNIWEAVIIESSIAVNEARDELSSEILSEKAKLASHAEEISDSAIAKADQTIATSQNQGSGRHSDHGIDGQDGSDPASRVGLVRARLRAALELHHMALFFRANAHFQIKTNEEMTKPDSPEFEDLDRIERDGYEAAKKLRREILQEMFNRVNTMMSTIKRNAESGTVIRLLKFTPNTLQGGAESRRIMENLENLGINLDNQAHQIHEWRDHLTRILLSSLVDNDDDGIEINGDEYEDSTKVQEEAVVYVQALRTMIADRHASLTGVRNFLTDQEAITAVREAKLGKGPSPERLIALFDERNQFIYEGNTVRGALSELRTLMSNLRKDRARNETLIVEAQLKMTHKYLTDQTKAATGLEKEVELFTKCMNLRVEYYKQLQAISNQVAPYTGPNNELVVEKMLQTEQALIQSLAVMRSKKRYLIHLKEEAKTPKYQRVCIICRDEFDLGVLTVCGHQFCSDCIKEWWRSHHKCPVCKRALIHADLHNITYKPQEPTLTVEAQGVREPLKERSPNSNSPRKSAIYSDVSKATLAAIKNVELPGNNSFGTKVDTLARHILYLRESDPGSKSIVYSQFADFLLVLSRAFAVFRIGHSSIGNSNGIEKFKNDAGTEVFLLHSRAHSAGLTLVNASHVFLCEPLLNTGLELQAIARVDRIGQTVATNVWLYLIRGTIEESIHELSVKRRLEHLGQAVGSKKGKGSALSDEELVANGLEEANSLELQKTILAKLLAKGQGGEVVSENDLWACLFGGRTKRGTVDLNNGNAKEESVDTVNL
ncbi:hypothetical protein SBOR_9212 [Sclerotinia borealis F-4128]|uniref:SNF2 family helicase/ATPase n=1 Tax=Sclerotinia borealis (strain F-4128) TaxID=1432307 RepID=W9C3F9_SCLBF|nr:hypothetical protein SBOR_9212 [Sclerotinia borealis F-4128]